MDDATVTAKLKADLTWIQKHERLILAVIAGVILWFAIGKIDTLIANHDTAVLHQAEVTANIQADWNAKQAQIVAQQAAEYRALAEKVTQKNASLEAANVTLATALTKQQKTDATLTTTQLVERWESLVPNTDFNGTEVLPDEALGISHTNAVATVQELEKVPALSSQLENSRTQYANDEQLLVAGKALNDTLYTQVDGLKLQIVDDKKVCKAEVASVKADARKSKRRWFLIGFISGFLSRQVIKP